MDMLFDPYADGPFKAGSRAAALTKSRPESGQAAVEFGGGGPGGGTIRRARQLVRQVPAPRLRPRGRLCGQGLGSGALEVAARPVTGLPVRTCRTPAPCWRA